MGPAVNRTLTPPLPTPNVGSACRAESQTRLCALEELQHRFSPGGIRRQRWRHFVRWLSWVVIVQVLSGSKRALDVVLALLLLTILSPVLAAIALTLSIRGRVLVRTPRLGRWCVPFDEYSFAMGGPGLPRVPVLFNVLRGEMSFVGPRPASPGEMSPRERAVRKRFSARPGLLCLWWIRRRANIAYGQEADADGEYVDSSSTWGDMGIALRAIPAVLYGEGTGSAPDVVNLLGIHMHNVTMAEAVGTIVSWLSGRDARHVCFVNAHCANIAYRDDEYLHVLNQADLTLADGIGLKVGGKLLGQDIKENVNGTDLFPRVCASLAGTGKGMFLLGARPGVAEAARDWIAQRYPDTVVKGCRHGYFDPAEEQRIIKQIRDSGAELLLVAMGVPEQDKWVHRHLSDTGAKVAIGVGGLLDFYSGRVPRAPTWVREIGFEWLYRFCREPLRMWRRYFVGNPLFLYRVLMEKFVASSTRAAAREGGGAR